MDEQLGDDASSPTSLAPVCARWTSSLAVASPSISMDEQIPVAPILRQRVPAVGCRGWPRLSFAPPAPAHASTARSHHGADLPARARGCEPAPASCAPLPSPRLCQCPGPPPFFLMPWTAAVANFPPPRTGQPSSRRRPGAVEPPCSRFRGPEHEIESCPCAIHTPPPAAFASSARRTGGPAPLPARPVPVPPAATA